MPRAKPAYDTDGSWKATDFTPEQWKIKTNVLQRELRPFYPEKDAVVDETFGHPADEFANALLSAANGAVSTMLYLRLRLTNEQLRAEQKDLLRKLTRAAGALARLCDGPDAKRGTKSVVLDCGKSLSIVAKCLDKISLDLNKLLDQDADVFACRDKLETATACIAASSDDHIKKLRSAADINDCRNAVIKLIPHIVEAKKLIGGGPRAKKLADAQHDAAVEMAVRVLHVLKTSGVSIAATADVDEERNSDAVKILKIIGDQLHLRLAASTWRDTIVAARVSSPSLNL